jgi:hypothetical protein
MGNRRNKKTIKGPDMFFGGITGKPDTKTIWTAIDRLREKGSEIYETDVFQHKDRFLFNVDKPWIQSSIHQEIQLMHQEQRDKKIDILL